MATIGSLALAIRARTDQLKGDLKPALDAIKDWGAAARSAGADAKEVDRAMARMRQEAMQGKGMAEGPRKLGEGLRNAKTAAAALTGAVSAVSSEMGGAVGHATRLGSSLIQSFLAGGPIGLGVTALAAGISAIAGATGGAAEAAERARKAQAQWLEDANKRTAELIENLQRVREAKIAAGLKVPELAAQLTEDRRAAKEVLDNLQEQAAIRSRIVQLEAERARIVAEVPDWVKKQGKNIHGRAAGTEFGSRGVDVVSIDDQVTGEKEKLAVLEGQMRVMEETRRAADEAERINRENKEAETKANAKSEEYAKRLKERVRGVGDEFERAAKYAQEVAKGVEKASAEADKSAAERDKRSQARSNAQGEKSLKRVKDLAKGLNEGAEAALKSSAEQKRVGEEVARDLELQRAANDFDRERLRVRRELEETVKRANGDEKIAADAKALAAGRLADITQREVEAAREKAEAERQATAEKLKQAQATKELLDITKRFANFNGAGGGLFGFGKGQVGYGWSPGGGDFARKPGAGAPPGPGAAPGAPGKGPTDIAARVDQLVAQIQKWAANEERTAGSIDRLGTSVTQGLARSDAATEKAIGSVARTQKELAAQVRQHEQRLARLTSGTTE